MIPGCYLNKLSIIFKFQISQDFVIFPLCANISTYLHAKQIFVCRCTQAAIASKTCS